MYVFNDSVWTSKDVIKTEMALDGKMFPSTVTKGECVHLNWNLMSFSC